jgi:hypothetical protein
MTESEPVASSQQAIGNGIGEVSGKYDGVVKVWVGNPPSSFCSGVLLTPLYVATANHCVTGVAKDSIECLPFFGDVTLYSPGDVTQPVTVDFHDSVNGVYDATPDVFTHTAALSGNIAVRTPYDLNLCKQFGASQDVAIFRLDTRVPMAEYPPIHPPLHHEAFGNRSCFHPFKFTATAVGFGDTNVTTTFGSDGGTQTRRFNGSDGWFFSQDNPVILNTYGFGLPYQANLKGDSGGPVIANGLACGIASRYYPDFVELAVVGEYAALDGPENQDLLLQHVIDVSETHWAGECNPDDPNPWDDPALTDTDTGEVVFGGAARGDGMPDACDPCPFEVEPNLRGDFTRGDDRDGDGVPDRCDNCPPELCEARGLAASFCANPYPADFGPQADSDGDGVGDACDSCPTVPNAGDNWNPSFDDPDGDYVGRACDNCDQRNSWRACQADAECTLIRTDGTILVGRCLEIGVYGRCDDDDGRICRPHLANKDCEAGVSCEFSAVFASMRWGRCNQVLDDQNNNGVGGPCDTCDAAPGVTVVANSNRFAEEREFAKKFGDACDPVPTYSARATPHELSELAGITRFIGAAGLGRDPDASYATPAPFDAEVGFRWTNCHFEGEDKASHNCYFQFATVDPNIGFAPSPGQVSTWKHVTTGFAPIHDFGSALFKETPADQIVQRTFDSVVRLDPTVHPFGQEYGEDEVNRVGVLENLIWYHDLDIAMNGVTTWVDPVNGKPRTTGLFWSHGLWDQTTTASIRDNHFLTTARGLRDHYGYVKTPLVLKPFSKPFLEFDACKLGPCFLKWKGDYLARVNPSILVAQNAPGAGVILPAIDGSFAAAGWFGLADVTEAISAPVASLTRDPELSFVGAVETGQRAAHFSSAQSVVVPKDWKTGSVALPLVYQGGVLQLADARLDQPAITQASVSSAGPSARSAPAYVFSARQSALYVVGGQIDDAPAGEVWRYDIVARGWQRLWVKGAATLGELSPRRVLAAGYDERATRLAFIDESAQAGQKFPLARLVVFDTARRTGHVALTLPRLGIFSRIDLTARGDGTWLLSGQVGTSKQWKAYRFRFDEAGKVDWLGLRVGSGLLLDQPINDTAAIELVVVNGKTGLPEAILLVPETFKPQKAGITAL